MELQGWLLYQLVAVQADCKQAMQPAEEAAEQRPERVAGEKVGEKVGGGRARELGLRAQKKLLSRFAASGPGKALLIDEAAGSMLDNLHRLMELAARACPALERRQPDKVLKNIVKLSIKVGLLQRNQQLEGARVEELRRALRSSALAVLSFHELDFSFDRAYMAESLGRARAALQALIRSHLTDKSHERADMVFDFLAHPDFLEAAFARRSPLRPALDALARDLDRALEAGHL